MMERAGKPADNFESEAAPQRNGAVISAHHKIKLHGLEAAFAGALQRMRAHGASHAPAGGPRSRDVATVGDVRAAALLVGLQEISAENLGICLCDEDFMLGSEPISERFLAAPLSRQAVGLPSANGGLQNRPNGIGVVRQ